MITLAIINFLLGVANAFIMNHLSNLIEPLTDIGTFVAAYQIPQTFLDVYSTVCYFVPVTTIAILSVFTASIVIFKGLVSILHFVGLGIIFGE